MIKTGHELSLEAVQRGYQTLGASRGMPREFYDRVLRAAGALEGLNVLDVGCGDAGLLQAARTVSPSARYTGADFLPGVAVEGVELVRADLRKPLPFPSGSFDVVFCTETLEHLPDPEACLREIRRLLKPSGKVVVSLPNAQGYFPFHLLGTWIPTRLLRRKLLPYEHPCNTQQPIDTLFIFNEITALFEKTGFRIERVTGWRYFRYLSAIRGLSTIYGAVEPMLEALMEAGALQRFAYNPIFVLRP